MENFKPVMENDITALQFRQQLCHSSVNTYFSSVQTENVKLLIVNMHKTVFYQITASDL